MATATKDNQGYMLTLVLNQAEAEFLRAVLADAAVSIPTAISTFRALNDAGVGPAPAAQYQYREAYKHLRNDAF
jgi:hypothetical protein